MLQSKTNISKKIFFLIPDYQFGYCTGYHYYAKYLIKYGYDVTILSLDKKLPKIEIDNDIKCKYLNIEGCNFIQYRLKIYSYIIKNRKKYDVFVLKYFKGVSFLSLFLNKKKAFLDIRTGSVLKNQYKRWFENFLLIFESLFFYKIFILSMELAIKLMLPLKKVLYLPLGAEPLDDNIIKQYSFSMNLLYIGTFFGRNIHLFIEGFAKFYHEYKNKIPITFDIIGDGSMEEKSLIQKTICRNELNEIVKMHGVMNHKDAKIYFQKCNYGISYIPMTKFYDLQPPTKTYEYILSGMVCIGTNTQGNKTIINRTNGILSNDDEVSVYYALIEAYNNRFSYDYKIVKSSLSDYKWENIVKNHMIKHF